MDHSEKHLTYSPDYKSGDSGLKQGVQANLTDRLSPIGRCPNRGVFRQVRLHRLVGSDFTPRPARGNHLSEVGKVCEGWEI